MAHALTFEYMKDENKGVKKYHADQYKCCPPPLFVIFISLVQLCTFLYYTIEIGGISDIVHAESSLIYRPDKRGEIWRFLTYMFLHAGWYHLCFNLLVQVLIGLPLEMVHGSTRIALIYFTGVLAGSLGTAVFDSKCMLVGASGGVYALLTAHLANIVLNYHQMELPVFKVVGIFLIIGTDTTFAIYDRLTREAFADPISYVAHLSGAFAGLTIGLTSLKNFDEKSHQHILWWLSLGIYLAAMLFAIIYNLFSM